MGGEERERDEDEGTGRKEIRRGRRARGEGQKENREGRVREQLKEVGTKYRGLMTEVRQRKWTGRGERGQLGEQGK